MLERFTGPGKFGDVAEKTASTHQCARSTRQKNSWCHQANFAGGGELSKQSANTSVAKRKSTSAKHQHKWGCQQASTKPHSFPRAASQTRKSNRLPHRETKARNVNKQIVQTKATDFTKARISILRMNTPTQQNNRTSTAS